MARPLTPNKIKAANRLRWQLLVALSGVGTVMASCAGRSNSSDDDSSGGTSATGGTGTTGGKGGTSTTGGTGAGGKGGTGANGGTSTTGGKGSTGGTSATGGASGNSASGGAMPMAGRGGTGGAAGSGTECKPYTAGSGQVGQCDGGYVQRPTPETCVLSEHQGAAGQGGMTAGEDGGMVITHLCDTDDDCDEGTDGYCVREELQGVSLYCIYACETDVDCAAGEVCTCDNTYISAVDRSALSVGRCVPGDCTTDPDCADGFACIAPVQSACGPRQADAFHCQSPLDECRGPDDCPEANLCVRANDHFECQLGATCGRPFLIEGALRHSELVEDAAWLDERLAAAPLALLSDEARATIAQHFAEAGLMEHASIAAFARFALQLLALGAPPKLVTGATAAMADETRHAELCFGLASRYAGSPVGPGPLDVSRSLEAVTLLDVVDLVVAEGCIGETAAALEAAWAADAATDAEVQRVLRGIADDEARHAALAWQFVSWAASRDASVVDRVEHQLRRASSVESTATISNSASQANTANGDETTREPRGEALLAAHGVLSLATRRAAREAALREVLPSVLEGVRIRSRAPREDEHRDERGARLIGLAGAE